MYITAGKFNCLPPALKRESCLCSGPGRASGIGWLGVIAGTDGRDELPLPPLTVNFPLSIFPLQLNLTRSDTAERGKSNLPWYEKRAMCKIGTTSLDLNPQGDPGTTRFF